MSNARSDRVGSHKTVQFYDPRGDTRVVMYHSTRVVEFDDKSVTLKSGGFVTQTTALRMNQASNQNGLGFKVNRKNGEFIVTQRNGVKLVFTDTITFNYK